MLTEFHYITKICKNFFYWTRFKPTYWASYMLTHFYLDRHYYT